MIESKLLKVKKWVDLNEAAIRLSIALDEPVNALDLMEFALEGELILSVKFPFDKKYIARKMYEKETPMGIRLKELFEFEYFFRYGNDGSKDEEYLDEERKFIYQYYEGFLASEASSGLSEHQKTFSYYCENIKMVEWGYGEISYLKETIYELSMLGAENIDVMWLIQQNREREMDELTNLDGVILRGSDGEFYNLQEKFDDEYIRDMNLDNSSETKINILDKFKLNERHYFPAGGLPVGCELGMSPVNMSLFERKLSEDESKIPEKLVLTTLGAALNEITSSSARKWTQGDLAVRIADKKIPGLSERTVNGIFAKCKKEYKSM